MPVPLALHQRPKWPPRPLAVLLLFILASWFVLISPVTAAVLDLNWGAPTTNSDGTPLQDLAGYRIYYGTSPTFATNAPCNNTSVDVEKVMSYRLSGLSDGAHYYTQVTALDTGGNESACSNETSGFAWTDSTQPPASGPVAAYSFDLGTGTTVPDLSGSNYTGTIWGATWTTGKYGSALAFDGVDDYVDTPFATDLPTWTVSVWVKSAAAPSSAAASGPAHREKNFQINWNHPYPNARGAAGIAVNGTWYSASFGTLAADTWYHLAATYDGETLRAYTNGVLITTNSLPSGPASPESASMKLGRHAAAAQYFQGVIDEVRLYNRALTQIEIQADMKTPVGQLATPLTATLTLVPSGTGSGTVTSSPAGITCGSDCSESYALNTAVSLTATPAAGSTFTGWSGACIGSGDCTLTLVQPEAVTATFERQAVSLTLARAGRGTGTVISTPAGINCGADCSESYPVNTTVTLTASPAAGATFVGWSGSCSGTGSCTVVMSQAQTVTATFKKGRSSPKR